jgi:hypothetical protein
MARKKRGKAATAGGETVNDLKRLAEWIDELGLDRVTADLIAGRLNAWWYDHETAQFHPIPRVHWQSAKQIKRAASSWGWPVKRDDDGRLFSWDCCKVFAAPVPVSQPIKRAQPPKQQRSNKPAQEEVLRRVREAYPDGVGNTSSYAVHKRISGKGYNPSHESVHRALGRERKK